jgi:glycogen debranching enzyme
LTSGSELAQVLNETDLAGAYAANASALKATFNDAFWDDNAGMYKDNLTTTLHPQDANSYAVLYNLTNSQDQVERISEGLTQNWNDIGAVCPELPDIIAPFIGGFEVSEARF